MKAGSVRQCLGGPTRCMARKRRGSIVTQVAPLQGFYPAEDTHQNVLARHPDYSYIVYYDLPKLRALQEQLPGLYTH